MDPNMVGSVLIIFFTLATISIAILATAFWVWMLIDCATKEPSEGTDKVVWLLVILLTHIVGALIYYFVRRPQRMSAWGINGDILPISIESLVTDAQMHMTTFLRLDLDRKGC